MCFAGRALALPCNGAVRPFGSSGVFAPDGKGHTQLPQQLGRLPSWLLWSSHNISTASLSPYLSCCYQLTITRLFDNPAANH